MKRLLFSAFLLTVLLVSQSYAGQGMAPGPGWGGSSNPTDIALDISSWDFGTVADGSTSSIKTFTAKNWHATNTYKVPSVATLTGTNAADYTITADNCNGNTLTNNQTCTVLAEFSPQSPHTGTLTASLNVPYCRSNSITWGSTPGNLTYPATESLTQASSTSTGTITYSTSTGTYCSVTGSPGSQTLNSLNASGSCVVHADQAASDPWCAATQVQSGSVTITAAGAWVYTGSETSSSFPTAYQPGVGYPPGSIFTVSSSGKSITKLSVNVDTVGGTELFYIALWSGDCTGSYPSCTRQQYVQAAANTLSTGWNDLTITPVTGYTTYTVQFGVQSTNMKIKKDTGTSTGSTYLNDGGVWITPPTSPGGGQVAWDGLVGLRIWAQ